jgi:nucleoside-diphosphate-sugar epimerase
MAVNGSFRLDRTVLATCARYNSIGASGRTPVVRSDGGFVRAYFHVEDGVAAYPLLAEKLSGHRALHGLGFNFSNEVQIARLDFVHRPSRWLRD